MTPDYLFDVLGGTDPQLMAPLWFRLGVLSAALVVCLAISIIDARKRIIPDPLNLLLAIMGIALAGFGGWEAAIGAALQGCAAFVVVCAFRHLYRALRGMQGLGFGDVKFLGAAATWVGIGGIAPLVLVACFTALIYVGAAYLRGERITGRYAMPFGPFLALGLVVVLGATSVWPPDA